jgi:adenine deaminase
MNWNRWLAVARGDEPADLSLRNGRVVNTATGEVTDADLAFAEGFVAGVGTGLAARETLDVAGRYIAPGLIDAHVHIESSLSTPAAFARQVVPCGTTAVVADPHEIANVAGEEGIRYMIAASEGLPLSVFFNLPACVPATPLGTAGAELDAPTLAALADLPRVLGLAEFMNVPGAVRGFPDCLAKLDLFRARRIDGHAPQVSGRMLQAYTGPGPRSDHEAVTADEAREKLRAGMYVFLREGTAARNLRDLLPAITAANSRRCAFCTDDCHPATLMDEGHIDHLIRVAVAGGLPWITAIQMATLNPCEFYGLQDRGLLAPGRRADAVVFSDPTDFRAEWVFSAGRCVGRSGGPADGYTEPKAEDARVRGSMRVNGHRVSFRIPVPPGARIRVIGVRPGQLVTRHETDAAEIRDGAAEAAPGRDLLKIAVIERHRGTGRVGLGFVRGLGLRSGALACSVAHDAHNLIVVGCDDRSMRAAVCAVVESGGGLSAACGDRVLARLALPIGGLMTDRPMSETRAAMDALVAAARELGAPEDPWMMLSFLSLEVIPELKLTDRGLVDVTRFELVPLVR